MKQALLIILMSLTFTHFSYNGASMHKQDTYRVPGYENRNIQENTASDNYIPGIVGSKLAASARYIL